MSTSDEVIAIAIDFGTTFSGVAFMKVHNKKPEPPTQLGQWPGISQLVRAHKVPTVVAYPHPNNGGPPLWGFTAEDSKDWGSDADDSKSPTYWKARLFKLLLDPDPTHNSGICTPPGITIRDMVSDYLQGLYTYTVKYLKDEGISHSNTKLNFILTVPASFEDGVIRDFRKIIKDQRTGIGGHEFVIGLTEPEAAAFHTIDIMPDSVQPGDCFIVCDAGGGTVDLSSYTISSLEPKIVLRHTGLLSGEYCGSTVIDREFEQSLELNGSWESLSPKQKGFIRKGFIRRKENFDDNPYDNYFSILSNPAAEGDSIRVSRDQMREFFAISLAGIQKMIKEHIDGCRLEGHEVRYIFLVGGLGSSPYIKQEVEKQFCARGSSLEVIQSSSADRAVIIGAVVDHKRFLEGGIKRVEPKPCRANYGLLKTEPYDPNKHIKDHIFVNPLDGKKMAKNQIGWLIYKGERIQEEPERCFVQSFTRDVKVCKTGKPWCWYSQEICQNGWHSRDGWEEVLVKSVADRVQLQHCLEPGVRKVCRMILNPAGINKSGLQTITKRGKNRLWATKYYRIEYTIKIYIGSTVGCRIEVIFKSGLDSSLMKVFWNEDEIVG